ncbi:MAG: hypothetical protein V4623_03920 [Pseudomonadota bacterium]
MSGGIANSTYLVPGDRVTVDAYLVPNQSSPVSVAMPVIGGANLVARADPKWRLAACAMFAVPTLILTGEAIKQLNDGNSEAAKEAAIAASITLTAALACAASLVFPRRGQDLV